MWVNSVSNELMGMFNQMNMLQWGIVSASAFAFGLMCLKGSGPGR